jgi:hypothetical protein
MNAKLAELERRQQTLIFRAAAQRDRLAYLCRQVRTPANFAKAAAGTFQAVRSLSNHPKLTTSFAALLFGALRPRIAKIALPLGIAVWGFRPLMEWWSNRRRP